jgi:uncharacterized protein DUF5655
MKLRPPQARHNDKPYGPKAPLEMSEVWARIRPRNMWHSCARYRIEDHFAGKDPAVRELFDRLRAFVESCGSVKVYAQKTKIVFQVRARFAGAVVRKNWLDCGFWLKRRGSHPLIRRVESPMPRDYIHRFRLTNWDEFDARLADLIREAYQVGCQDYHREA